MNVLVIGNGGREHALVWKIKQSSHVKKIYCAPGNAGISHIATCVPIDPSDTDALCQFAIDNQIDLTVVGPEVPLVTGIVNHFEKNGLKIFGPQKKAAQIEGSKSFAKYMMDKYNIPTAKYETFTDESDAINYLKKIGAPVVVKADGLAAGKGVIVCLTEEEALEAVHAMLTNNAFGAAGQKIVIEEKLIGEEASFLAFTDGETILPLPSSQDHKAIYENDKGPNTGGMGAYSPAPIIDHVLHEKIMTDIMHPMVKGLHNEGATYKGLLYAGLMIHNEKINVLEFNARFGDPECQPLLMRVKTDIVDIMMATIDGQLKNIQIEIDERPAVCVVMASKGYPGKYQKGATINGLEKINPSLDHMVFHSGTAMNQNQIVTNGGRVLGVTALGQSIQSAISNAYQIVHSITWDGVYYRKDIGHKALNHLKKLPLVGIIMGSDSDYEYMKETVAILKQFDIPYEITIASAHRTPQRAMTYAQNADKRGIQVLIAAAGMAAHLAGSIAANTILPVIGVPIPASLQGFDSLLSTVQMPPGVPVATVAIGKPGAKNAAILAVQMLALCDHSLSEKLSLYKLDMVKAVEQKARQLL